ncbi:gamma-glutamyl hydrolase 2-like [Solanum pennellii]|uniref:folate gamma-glutamyl hydrolase n=1 Tax=Solanum pennellii TaxID=28526 RepID=A0ABM1HQ87_SOLPN|nr:gamma-glutamyl hydrolase 2-like [Solanum pennellii]
MFNTQRPHNTKKRRKSILLKFHQFIKMQMETNFLIPFFTIFIQLMATHVKPQLIESQLSFPSCTATDPALNYRPVIGIVSHPGDGASGRLNNASDVSYIAASYVKFAEMAGARVIPIIYTEPPEIINQKLNLVNGIIFTGGWSKKGLYFEVVKGIFEKVLEKNDAGEHFPLLAICLGFELLTMIISKDNNILEEFSASHQASTVQFVENIKFEGTVFGRFPPVLLKKMTTHCLVMQNHRFGISPERLQANNDLCGFFKILTTSVDKKNKAYVSSVQAQHYPITALQWHPEKNVFEWGSSQIPHTEDAIQVSQHVANYFISEARKSSNNKPATSKVLDNLIYNYSPSYAGKVRGSFEEVYLFTPRPTLSSL